MSTVAGAGKINRVSPWKIKGGLVLALAVAVVAAVLVPFLLMSRASPPASEPVDNVVQSQAQVQNGAAVLPKPVPWFTEATYGPDVTDNEGGHPELSGAASLAGAIYSGAIVQCPTNAGWCAWPMFMRGETREFINSTLGFEGSRPKKIDSIKVTLTGPVPSEIVPGTRVMARAEVRTPPWAVGETTTRVTVFLATMEFVENGEKWWFLSDVRKE